MRKKSSWQPWNRIELDPRVCGSILLYFFPPGSLGSCPIHAESVAIDNGLIKGLLSSHFHSLPCGQLDESALLPLYNSNCPDLSQLVEVISEVCLSDGITQTTHIQYADGLILRRV